ncbi:MAG: adenosylmethionine--8-amino-7-oxononanoate transaminase [Planctomycetia bacterium]|nr:adenosylmethionine--8-amino-7-oxononanoate transaminase [Planctomycetia bacterium]
MMDSAELLEKDRKYLWHPYASMKAALPVNPVVGACGTRIRLADGTELLDALSSWWCVCHGHNRSEITQAIQEQTARFTQVMFAGFTHEPAVRLAEKLLRRTPAGLERVFYSDSGSVSVECAVKMAVQYQAAAGHPHRTRMATVRGGYHGDTAGAWSLGDPDAVPHAFRDVTLRHFFAPRPETPFDADWNPADFAPMETLLEQHEHEIAGVILEPIFQGGNRMFFYHPEYLKKLREACDRYGILLLFDEVATGFGRLGKFFAAEFAGISPDILCVGKGLVGGSVGLAATLTTPIVADTIADGTPPQFPHGPTFMANPVVCAAGCASLDLFDAYDWQKNVHAIEKQLTEELADLRNAPQVRDVRVLGAVGVVEMEPIPTPGEVQQVVRETGVWLRPFGNWLYTMPPFVTTPDEIHQIVRAFRRIIMNGKKTLRV